MKEMLLHLLTTDLYLIFIQPVFGASLYSSEFLMRNGPVINIISLPEIGIYMAPQICFTPCRRKTLYLPVSAKVHQKADASFINSIRLHCVSVLSYRPLTVTVVAAEEFIRLRRPLPSSIYEVDSCCAELSLWLCPH